MRTGLIAVVAASVAMLLLHAFLALRERKLASMSEAELEATAAEAAKAE